ncbi:hypothetical protein ACO2Q3_02040 [Caulobacter sp. KR2-114]|uniref:hypothetical protein n=1 Tax=Caulobacter sp. KR2-114 TaxID=3400912 RepID=UPI003C0DAD15
MQYNQQARTRRFGRGASIAALMCGVAAVGLAAPGVASAKARKHHAAPAAPSASKAELDELRAEVQDLKAWKDSQAAAQAQTQADLNAARQAAADATARAEHAEAQVNAQIQTIPGEVQGEVKSQVAKSIPPKGWEGSTSVNGRMYWDVSSINQRSDSLNTANPLTRTPGSSNGVGFDIKRFYVGIDHKFNDMFSANITTDFNYQSSLGQSAIYIKKAYLQAKFNDAFIVRAGSADLPWVPFMEDQYGNRYIENVMIDRDKFGTSADWGVHALGKFGQNGMFQYQVSVINGSGYKAVSTGTGSTRTHSVDVEGRLSMNVQHFTFAVGGYDGKLGKDTIGSLTRSASRFDAAGIYNDGRFRVGVEYFKAWNYSAVPLASAKDEAEGVSGFASFNINKQVAIFGRYDWVNPRQLTVPHGRDNYFNVGISYEPVKIVDFALVYKRDSIDNINLSTSNGSIGPASGSAAAMLGRGGTYDEFGLWGQVRW